MGFKPVWLPRLHHIQFGYQQRESVYLSKEMDGGEVFQKGLENVLTNSASFGLTIGSSCA